MSIARISIQQTNTGTLQIYIEAEGELANRLDTPHLIFVQRACPAPGLFLFESEVKR